MRFLIKLILLLCVFYNSLSQEFRQAVLIRTTSGLILSGGVVVRAIPYSFQNIVLWNIIPNPDGSVIIMNLRGNEIVIVQNGNCQIGEAVFASNYLGNAYQTWILNDDGTISPQCNVNLAMHVTASSNYNVLLGDINDNDTRTTFEIIRPFS